MTDVQAPSRERKTDRAEEVSVRRRDRYLQTAQDLQLRRFGQADSILDLDKFIYRAAVDEGTRLINLTAHDDYDFVARDGGGTLREAGDTAIRYQSGRQVDGSPQWTYLLRKPKQFADEDRSKRLAKNDELTSRLLQGEDKPSEAPDKSYTPKR